MTDFLSATATTPECGLGPTALLMRELSLMTGARDIAHVATGARARS